MSTSLAPVRRLFTVVNGGTPTADVDNWDGDVAWATPMDLGASNGGLLGSTGRTITERGLATGSAAIGPGCLLCSTRAPIGYVVQTSTRTAFNQGCRGLVPRTALDVRFYRYAIAALSPALQVRGQGSTFSELSTEGLASLPVPNPATREQCAIADFLDAATARIDDLLSKKQRLVGLLQERVDSELMTFVGSSDIVHGKEAVTAAPIRRVLCKLDRPVREDQIVTAFRDGQVTARALRRSEGFTQSWTDAARVQGVRSGDVVVHGLDGFAGAIGTSEVDGVCSPIYHVAIPTDGGDSHCHGRLLRLLATTGYLGMFASSTRERAVDFRNWDLFGRIPIPRIDVVDQRRIGDRIRKLAPLRVAVDRSAELVAERKQALVTAAVTGQLDLARELAKEAS